MRIAFCHPDLGLGGAERLVLDAALELQSRGHQVEIFTAHHEPGRCFQETVNGELPPIRVHGDWLPRHVFGKGHAFCAILRCVVVSIAICRSAPAFDAVFADQVSAVLPAFKLFRPAMRILFYCHFPDLLLSKQGGWLKRLYRWPLDALEQMTTGLADLTLVNSAFTAEVFAKTFPALHRRGVKPQILYPAVQIPPVERQQEAEQTWSEELPTEVIQFLKKPRSVTFLSINRFERKKRVDLAIHALEHLMRSCSDLQPQLLVAGGYDARVAENVEHLEELRDLTHQLRLEASVYFFPSFTDRQKLLLLAACVAVVYTPPNEHFGIVPLESMAFEKPVIACNSGGPIESIVHKETGFLAHPTAEAFGRCMKEILSSDVTAMGRTGSQRVQERFSRSVFGERLTGMLSELICKKEL